MTKKRNLSLAILVCFVLVIMLVAVFEGAVPASAANWVLPETKTFAAATSSDPVPYDGVPVTPGQINSANYRSYGLTDENWKQYNGYYAIRNSKELYGFAALTRAMRKSSHNAVLLADIVINTTVSANTGATYLWESIAQKPDYANDGGYAGTFDGNGYSISGIYMTSDSFGMSTNFGFFGAINNEGVVKNLVLKNSVFLSTGSIAVFAHNHYGMVSACRVESSVILKNEISGTGVSGVAAIKRWAQNGNTYIGGIENTYSAATLQVIEAESVGVIAGTVASANNLKNNYGVESNGFKLIGSTIYQTGKVTTLTSQNDAHVCTPIVHNQVNGTCYSSGLSAYTFCAVCEKVLSGEKTVLYGHSTTERVFTPNETDNAKHDERCAECNEITGEGNHYFAIDASYTCSRCEFSFLDKHSGLASYTFNQESYTLTQNLHVIGDLVIPEGKTLIVPEGINLIVSVRIINHGTIMNYGGIALSVSYGGNGTVVCGANATAHPAFNEDGFCRFCENENYPEKPALVDGVYQIANVGNLMWFSNVVSAGNVNANAVLTNDIVYNEGDLSGLKGKTDGYRFWEPIGMIMNHETGVDHFVTYTGTFDGQGYSISGLYHFDYWSYAGNAGLFSKLGSGGVIKNVTVKNSYIASSSYAGAILGQNHGGLVENCHSVNTTVASAARVGGIVGDNSSGTIRSCTNQGNVKFFMVNPDLAFGFSAFGGIAGNTTGTIEYCTNYGDIISSTTIGGVGGIAGQIYQGTVKNCVNEGDINVSGGTNFGGITGYQYHGTLSYNINYGSIAGGNLVGGIIGNPLGNGGRYTHNYTVGGNALGAGNKDGCFSITESELANGRLAFELGMGQKLGVDARPSLDGPKVYAYYNNSGVVNYTNNANYTCHHKGGTATCDARAVCDGCRNPYGEIREGAHKFEITGREDKPNCTVCGGRCGDVAPHSTNYIDYCAICGDWIPPVLAEDGFYELKNFGNLMWFAAQVNAGNYDLNARLISNITYGATYRTTQWVPIAGSSIEDTTVGYKGIFDGQGYSISLFPQTELLIPAYDGAVLGLFGTLAEGAVVKNLSISNRVEITFKRNGANYTYDGDYTVYFGLVAGRVLEGATVSGCRVANGSISISKGVLGAIVGVNYGTVENCISYGMTLSGPAGHVGGIVGDYNGGELINCYTTYASLGSVADGYVGASIACEAGVSNERIASGEIAYTMNTYVGNSEFWYQATGSGGPVGRSEYNVVGKIVYFHDFGDVVFYSNNALKVVISSDYIIPAGTTLLIPSGTTLEIAKDVTLTNEGILIANGILTGKGTLAGNGAFQVTDLDVEDITIPQDFTFDGTDHYDAVVGGLEANLVYMGKTFSPEGYIRTFNFTAVKNAGEYTVTYTAEHETLTYRFNVNVLAVSDSDVSLDKTSFAYNGKAHEPLAVLSGVAVDLGRDYYVTYSNNVSAGTATATITFLGNFSGEFVREFTISSVAIGTDVVVNAPSEMTYTGVALTPVTLTVGDVMLTPDDDFEIVYTDNLIPGTATATIRGLGSVSGEATVSFVIQKVDFTITVLDQILPYNEDINVKPFDQTMYEGEGLLEGHTVVLGEKIDSHDEIITLLAILDAEGNDVSDYYNVTKTDGMYHMFYETYRNETEGYHLRRCVYNCDEVADYEEHHGGVVTCSENGICIDCGITYLWATGEHTYENGVCTGCDYNPEYVLVLDEDKNGQHSGTELGYKADYIYNIFNYPDRQYVVVKDFEGGFAGVGKDNTTIILDLFGHTIDMTNSPYGFAMQANNLVVLFKSTAEQNGTLIGYTNTVFESVRFTLDNVRYEGTLYNSGTICVQNGSVLYAEITNYGTIYLPEGYDLSTIVSYEGNGTLYVGEVALAYNAESGKLECVTNHTWSDADCTTAKTCSYCGATDGDPLGHDSSPATCTEDEYCVRCETVIEKAHGHTTKVLEAVDPTCDDTGLTEGSCCEICGEPFVAQTVIPALGHKEGDPVKENNVDATCTTGGSFELVVYCTICADELSRTYETVPALGHTEVKEATVTLDPTCTSAGFVDYKYTCSVCGEYRYEREVIPAAGHTLGDPEVSYQIDPSCSGEGVTQYLVRCTVCTSIQNEYEVTTPKLDHVPNIEAPTCDAHQTCTQCGQILQEAIGHDYVDTVIVADCYTAGGIHHVCSVCNTGYFEVTEAQFEHTPNIEAATCTEDKVCIYCESYVFEYATGHTDVWATCTEPHHCSVCNEVFGDALGHVARYVQTPCEADNDCMRCGEILETAVGHDYQSEVTAEPDCNQEGEMRCTCTKCGDSYSEPISQLEHNPVSQEGKPSTCTQQGYNGATVCSLCEAVLTPQKPLPLENHVDQNADGACDACGYIETCVHAWDEGVINQLPTCTEMGVKTFTCTLCGETMTEWVDAVGHDHKATVTAPTCTERGYTTYTCHCGDSYVADRIDALGHTEQTIAGYAATCTESGLTDGKQCSVCEEMLVAQESIAALGHSCNEATCTQKATCAVCGYEEGDFAEHVDANEDGKCDACEYQMTPVIPDETTPEETTPEVPEDTTPELPEETTPEVPEETTPELPEETTPEVLEETAPEQPAEEPKKGLSGGAIAGIAVGSTAVVGAGGFSVFWFVIKKKRFSDLLAFFKK